MPEHFNTSAFRSGNVSKVAGTYVVGNIDLVGGLANVNLATNAGALTLITTVTSLTLSHLQLPAQSFEHRGSVIMLSCVTQSCDRKS